MSLAVAKTFCSFVTVDDAKHKLFPHSVFATANKQESIAKLETAGVCARLPLPRCLLYRTTHVAALGTCANTAVVTGLRLANALQCQSNG